MDIRVEKKVSLYINKNINFWNSLNYVQLLTRWVEYNQYINECLILLYLLNLLSYRIMVNLFFLFEYCHESGSHSLKLHITLGLHFPSCTALTHSRPPLHQSHSCHHSLINSDCLTTPAPHSLTHIKAAHKHSPSAKSCFALATFLSVLPRICYLCVWPRTARPSISEPVPVTSTSAWYCLHLCFASDIPVMPADHCLCDSAAV